MRQRPPRSPLFPYTTLFRSLQHSVGPEHLVEDLANDRLLAQVGVHHRFTSCRRHVGGGSLRVRVTSTDIWMCAQPVAEHRVRSEEHTSELQSQSNLVCRLLL